MRGRDPRSRSATSRWIWLVAAVAVCAVVGACDPDIPYGADVQNDSSIGFIVEAHVILANWGDAGGAFEVPAHTRGHLLAGDRNGPNQVGSTATLYTLDCTRVATLDLQGDRTLVYIDPEGQASALTGPESVPNVSPAAAESQIEAVPDCLSRQGPTPASSRSGV